MHRASLDFAGLGVYSEAALAEMSPERLARFFVRKGDATRCRHELRQMVVFAQHNLIKDAPFTKLDLISCRNLVIYLQPPAQKKALSLFHFGLKTGGILFLGPSESPGELPEEFDPLDAHWKIYRKRRDVRLPPICACRCRSPMHGCGRRALPRCRMPPRPTCTCWASTTRSSTSTCRPACWSTRIGPWCNRSAAPAATCRLRDGRVSTDLLDMVDPDLRMALAGALQRACKDAAPRGLQGAAREPAPTASDW